MPSCAFDKCKNHSRKENKKHGITFHSFPKDESWGYKWIHVVRKQRQEPKWTPTIHSRICSLHFKPEEIYTTAMGRKMINHGAVPSVKKVPVAVELDSENSESDSGAEEILADTYLRRKIEKVIADKKRLLQVVVNLKKQNKRLVAKCKNYKDIAGGLRDKVHELESRLQDQKK